MKNHTVVYTESRHVTNMSNIRHCSPSLILKNKWIGLMSSVGSTYSLERNSEIGGYRGILSNIGHSDTISHVG